MKSFYVTTKRYYYIRKEIKVEAESYDDAYDMVQDQLINKYRDPDHPNLKRDNTFDEINVIERGIK